MGQIYPVHICKSLVKMKGKIMRRVSACQARLFDNFLKLHFRKGRSKGLMQRTFVCQNVLDSSLSQQSKLEGNTFKELFV
jgi:hypothetical protein